MFGLPFGMVPPLWIDADSPLAPFGLKKGWRTEDTHARGKPFDGRWSRLTYRSAARACSRSSITSFRSTPQR